MIETDYLPVGAGVGQIKFPATQNPSSDANTLDDYEEGTWTPVVAGTTTAGVGTYERQWGRYCKIGKIVTIHLAVNTTAHTGTGNLKITGLPFASTSQTNSRFSCSIGIFSSFSFSANNIPQAHISEGQSQIALLQTPIGGGFSADIPLDASGYIGLSCTYEAAD